jgi:PKD repeat protein
VLEQIDTLALIEEDKELGISNRYSKVDSLGIDIKASGLKTEIADKGYIWRYQLTSSHTHSLGLLFSSYVLPEGARLYIYNEAHTRLLGAFSNLNNKESKQLAIAELNGDNATIEYFEPYSVEFEGSLVLGSVSQSYKDMATVMATEARIGINCEQGSSWQDQKHSVCRMTYTEGRYGYYCTGFLINNVKKDEPPYFMSANHCISTNTVAATLVTYFNYENSSCSSEDADATQTLSGATLTATNDASDFTLLLLDEIPPKDYSAYLAGWEISRSPLTGTCIHHPEGTAKCISVDDDAPQTYARAINWDDGNTTSANTHWSVSFEEGNTEGGSSGSPLFDDNFRAIGQLHGGDDTQSFYGKISVSWNNNSASTKQLKYWLDPAATGATSIDGTYFKINPVADFSVTYPAACIDNAVTITDNTKYSPKTWEWKIEPTTYTLANGTELSSQNLQVVFNESGEYSVQLITSNDYGSDTLVKSNFIQVVDDIQVSVSGIPADSIICGCNLTNFPIIASGALSYSFSVDETDKIEYEAKGDTLYLSLIESEKKNGSFTAQVNVTGSLGTCTDTHSYNLKIEMPPNDDIENAIRLWPGDNGEFTNFCASAEDDEPLPPLSSCYSAEAWCPSSDDSISNSIWFTFFGTANGKLTIDTKNINNRIAVYEADSYADILSGNESSYTIIGANDDRSSSDVSAQLEDLQVVYGKKILVADRWHRWGYRRYCSSIAK